jgi:hypothetical protein
MVDYRTLWGSQTAVLAYDILFGIFICVDLDFRLAMNLCTSSKAWICKVENAYDISREDVMGCRV